ncbi:MAG TPA: hypothetical protein VF799_04670 [Geobacteraceae bacterium]
MAEALKMVKAEFGLDAMILNSREEKRKGLMGLFRKPCVEVTAAMGKATEAANPPEARLAEPPATTRDEFRNAMLEPLAREIRQLREKVNVLYERDQRIVPEGRLLLPDGAEPKRAIRLEAAEAEKGEEFAKVQWREDAAAGNSPAQAAEALPDEAKKSAGNKEDILDAVAEELQRNGVETEIAATLLKKITSCIGRKRRKADIGKGLAEALESMVEFAAAEGEDDGRRIIALVGPTGVGKTTTIAKMALNAAKQGKKVAILSADNMKPGDVEHLKRCAGPADITIDSAATPQKLGKAIKSHRERDVVLIDTGGVSPSDREGMERLEKLLTTSPLIEKHLCLSSTTRDRELAETVKRFGRYAIDRLIFTRLDESETFGSIINVMLRSNVPPSFLTTGQKVTGNIETATAGRLAQLAMGGRQS